MKYGRLASISAAREAPPSGYGNLPGLAKAPNACTGSWTDERIELLTKLWQDGLSASQIAKQLRGVTRNAVIGKVNRLGLTGRDAPYKPGKPAAVTSPQRPPPPRLKIAGRGTVFAEAESRPARVVIPFREEPPGSCNVMTIGAHQCRWPIGEPTSDEFTFCGASTPEGPYCAAHRQRAFTSEAIRKWVDRKLAMPVRARFS